MSLATRGEVFDLGLTYSRRSFKWPGHSPGEIITFRSPDGIRRMQDPDAPPPEQNRDQVYWHSAAMFISDNVATQIDGLGHITAGPDDHWYNGFKESDWGGDWGPRKCDASTIPPIVARGVLIDVAAFKKVDALPGHTLISTKDLQDTLAWEGVTLARATSSWSAPAPPGSGATTAPITPRSPSTTRPAPTSPPPSGSSRTRGRSWSARIPAATRSTPPPTRPGTIIPVHRYLLVDQGVHLGEFHNLEGLSRAKAYTFCYVATVNKIKGAAAGFALRPLALR